ncbi:MAG: sugar phosphate isomerase/epimerase family protein [Anaerolineae bacterium]
MKKGICWGTLPPALSVEERVVLAAQAKLDGIEPVVGEAGSDSFIRYDSTAGELQQAVRLAKDNGLTYCSLMGGSVHSRTYPIVDDDPAVRAKGMDAIRRLFEITAALEAEVLLLVPHWVQDKVRYDYCYQRTLEALQKLGPEAQAAGVVIGLENVWNKFLLSPIEFARIIDEANSPAVQAYFDVGNVLVWAYPQHWIEILGKRIARVHVKDFRTDVNNAQGFAQLLNGDVNWPAVRKALRDIGYDGWITAEVGRYRYFPQESIYDTSVALDRIIALP